jgi:hypothetical protein
MGDIHVNIPKEVRARVTKDVECFEVVTESFEQKEQNRLHNNVAARHLIYSSLSALAPGPRQQWMKGSRR